MKPATSSPYPLKLAAPQPEAPVRSSSRNLSDASSRSSLDRYDRPETPSDVSWSSERVGSGQLIDVPQMRFPSRLAKRIMAVIKAQQRSLERQDAMRPRHNVKPS